MKRFLAVILGIMLFTCAKANASMSAEQTSDPEFLINAGYSEALAEHVFMAKNRANGKPVEPLYDKSHNGFVRFLRNAYSYIDPAIDSEERYHHNIQMSPSYKDL